MDKTRKVRNRWVNVRMNEDKLEKLEANRKKTTERNNSDYIRKLAFNQPIKMLTRDASLDALTNELFDYEKN
ncbi:hypothetical protein [Sediminibacterium sp.]|uniref:plasmid mobilization protein n=1 Tax=Sediminibacterium sp. TaxID=1917865 RepID=UPI0027306F78|nr:hypothetical protein [Sediminibacterium sp.]MDP2422164.1 hypothetical protein [Sediminibacterium sp.]